MKSKAQNQINTLKRIFVKMLETSIEIMNFQLTLTDKPEEKKGLKRFIKEEQKAIALINSVKHYEILVSLYNSYINGKESYFVSLCRIINNKDTIRVWDKDEKGFQKFIDLENEARAKTKEEYEKKLAEQERIKQAKAEGKKVEMVLENGKLTPRIVEES